MCMKYQDLPDKQIFRHILRRRTFYILCLCLLILALIVPLSQSEAQETTPIDIFIAQNREAQRVDVFFTNAVTGLSSVVTIDNFSADFNVLEHFRMAANGVLMRSPLDNLPYLITPGGNIARIDFIPQRADNLLGVDWVISEDGRTIAWAELFFQDNIWQATLYVSRLDGSEFRQLPPLPERSPVSATRVAMVAVSNDGSRVFLDLEHPTAPRTPDDLFIDYRSLSVYIEQQRTYRPLPSEADCLCPAQIAHDGQTYVRLELPILGNGYAVRIWNLDNNRNLLIPAVDTIYQQAGGVLTNSDGSRVIYSMGGIEGADPQEPPVFALVVADRLEGTQRIISAPDGQEVRVVQFINREQEAIVVDTRSGVTYKFDLETGTFDLVADKIWLGTLSD